MVFRGTFEYSLDAKNRLTVPARFRTALSEGVVLAKGLQPCVALWTPPAFDAYAQAALAAFHPLSPEAQKLNRFFTANSVDTALDAAGRVMVPSFLLQHAGLGKDVTVTGSGAALEIWDRDAWATYNDTLVSDIAEITSRLGHTA